MMWLAEGIRMIGELVGYLAIGSIALFVLMLSVHSAIDLLSSRK